MNDSFGAELDAFIAKAKAREQACFIATVQHVQKSIQMGDPLTGAPGQVVADVGGGNLRGSWNTTFETPTLALVATKVPYAESNEDGIARPSGGPYIQRSAIGGRWNVALTIAGFPAIVESERARLNP